LVYSSFDVNKLFTLGRVAGQFVHRLVQRPANSFMRGCEEPWHRPCSWACHGGNIMSVSNLAVSIQAQGPEPSAAATLSVERRRPPSLPGVGPLSPREGQVLGLIDGGMTSKEVAFQLGVSDATVRVLVSRALRKLGRPRRRRR
jgi:DNA-binding CsgD family transcriptional regulator